VLVFNTFCCGRIHVWGLEFVVDVLSLQDLELISIWYSCNNSQCGHSCHTWPRILLIWGFGSFGQFQINISLPKRYYLELKKKKTLELWFLAASYGSIITKSHRKPSILVYEPKW
jgi:hypothetical protein